MNIGKMGMEYWEERGIDQRRGIGGEEEEKKSIV